MKVRDPKGERCYVEVRDANGKRPSRYATVYDATPDQIIERLKEGESGRQASGRKPKAVSAA